ncbi:MAG: AGE family epimerase/isomerase [Planctomycetota bacterium]
MSLELGSNSHELQPASLATPAGQAAAATLYRHLLLDECLPFWFPRCIDRNYGGYLHCVDRDGTVVDTDKSIWAQGRMAWMLLTLVETRQLNAHPDRSEWQSWAESGLEFLRQYGFSAANKTGNGPSGRGQMYFHVTREGRPIRRRRYVYSEAFAAIAFARYASVSGDEQSAELSRELFARFVDVNFTPERMAPKFTDERPLLGLAPRMITIVTAQEMSGSPADTPDLRKWIDRCIQQIADLFYKPELGCVMESVQPDGSISDHFDGRLLNPGHAIEGAWFVLEEARRRSDSQLTQLGCGMLDCMWQRGWDSEFGGLFYFRDVWNRPVQEYWHDMKFWWPHNEALIATLLAWKLTGHPKYLDWHCAVFNWSFRHFHDRLHGEWFGYLHRDGRLSGTLKGNLWKSFFHYPRALWKCWQLLDEPLEETLLQGV